MQIRIEKIVYPGKSLARAEGKVVFADQGLPGELLEVRVRKDKKSYLQAEATAVLEPSVSRVTPSCDHYRICSPYQYIDYPAQLEIKSTQIREMFAHDLKLELEDCRIVPSSCQWAYRNKVQLHIIWENDVPYPAYHLPETHNQYAKVKECRLISPQMNSLIGELLKIVARENLRCLREFVIRQSNTANGELLLVVYIEGKGAVSGLTKKLLPLTDLSPLAGITAVLKGRYKAEETIIWGKDNIRQKIGEIGCSHGARCFFQVNTPMLELLLEDIRRQLRLTGKETIADLYCGVGTFGLALAASARHVYAVESLPENIRYLKKNIYDNSIENVTIFQGQCEKWIDAVLKKEIDVLILDPPRKGLEKRLCEKIISRLPTLLLYVSCKPSTLIRDLKMLLSVYRLRSVVAYDFFSHTPHVETLTVLEKK